MAATTTSTTAPLLPLPYLRGELDLRLEDTRGLAGGPPPGGGYQDIQGFLDGYLTLDRFHLQRWMSQYIGRQWGVPPWFTIVLTEVGFDESGFLLLRCRMQLLKGLAWSHVEIQFGIAENGALVLGLRRHRLPARLLLEGMQALLTQLVENKINRDISYLKLGLGIVRHGRYLYVRPHLREIVVPIRKRNYLQLSGLADIHCVFRRDSRRNLQMVFDKVRFLTSSDPYGQRGLHWDRGDRVELHMALQAMASGQVSFSAQGQLELSLSEAETRQIQLQGHSLSEVLDRLHLQIDVNTEISISPSREVHIQAHNTWSFRDLQILGKTYRIQPTDMQISFDPRQGLQLEFLPDTEPVGNYEPQLSENALRILIDGPAYLEAMLAAIRSARHWVDLETFLYFPGHTTRRITRALALKAAGLRELHPGHLDTDPHSPQGVPVYVLFSNLEVIPEHSEPVLAMFREEIARLGRDIQQQAFTARHKRQLRERIQTQLRYHSYVEGIARADHRKLLLIDGHTCYIGGINLGDKFLAPDSFHDVMIECVGPAVIKAQQAFMENWWRVARQAGHPQPRKPHALLRRARRAAHRRGIATSPADVILTDARQTEIAWAIRHVLEKARRKILIEHSYFYHPETLNCLKRALNRGVAISIIVPEVSNIEIFNPTNTDAIRQLMEHQRQSGRGKVRAWLYTGFEGEFSRMAHTKALAVDGKWAVVGSANLTLRSLQSPFKEVLTGGSDEHILFNQEIDLYIEDSAFVRRFERALFEEDLAHRARRIKYPQVLERLAALGGQRELQKAEWGARLA